MIVRFRFYNWPIFQHHYSKRYMWWRQTSQIMILLTTLHCYHCFNIEMLSVWINFNKNQLVKRRYTRRTRTHCQSGYRSSYKSTSIVHLLFVSTCSKFIYWIQKFIQLNNSCLGKIASGPKFASYDTMMLFWYLTTDLWCHWCN